MAIRYLVNSKKYTGTGSPIGVVLGAYGDFYEDTDTDLIYKCTGGLNWKIDNETDFDDTQIQTDLVGKLEWKGNWTAGSYTTNSMVVDGTWMAVSKNTTTDRPAPTKPDTPAWLINLATSPTWEDLTATFPSTFSKMTWTVPDLGYVDGIRLWLIADPNIRQTFVLYKVESDNSRIELDRRVYENVAVEGWYDIATFSNDIQFPGTIFEVGVFTEIITGMTERASGIFQYAGESDIDPYTGGWNNSSSDLFVRISDAQTEALGAVDWSSVAINDVISLTQGFAEYKYRVTSVATYTGGYTFGTTLLMKAGSIASGSPCDVKIEFMVASGHAPYVRIANAVVGIADVDGGLEEISDDHAYGVDIQFDLATISPNWDLIPLGTNVSSEASAALETDPQFNASAAAGIQSADIDAWNSGGEVVSITWAALVALGTRAIGQKYNITDANPADGITYGEVILSTANTFSYFHTAGQYINQTQIITII